MPDFTFFGTSPRSADFLNQIVRGNLKPALIISAPPKPADRKKISAENSVTVFAQKNRFPCLENLQGILKPGKAKEAGNFGLVLDFNRIIPPSVIENFPKGIINIHFSRLPLDRGPARGEQFILKGEPKAWISYLLITPGLDEGPVLAQTSMNLSGRETFGELSDTLVAKAASEIKPIINDYLAGKITPRPQRGKPTYAEKFAKSDFFILPEVLRANLKKGGEKAVGSDRLIRAASPKPGAWTTVSLDNQTASGKMKRLKILRAHLEGKKLVLDRVQLEGKKPVTWRQFCEGYPRNDLV